MGVKAWLSDLALPSTDGAAFVQAAIVLVVTVAAGTLVRRERSLVLLAAGVGTVLLGLMGVRALH